MVDGVRENRRGKAVSKGDAEKEAFSMHISKQRSIDKGARIIMKDLSPLMT